MPNKFIFADEAGCFTFKRQKGASTYFLLCTLATTDCSLSHDLLHIRRELTLAGLLESDKLHATEDVQSTRDRVFSCLQSHDFRVDVTILEKAKAQPQTRINEPTFYQYAWYYHFKHIGNSLARGADKILITAASLGTKKTKASFKLAVNNTLQQTAPRNKWAVTFIESAKDPLLWAADYCAWAVQRKWETGDTRSYSIISPKIFTEYDLWGSGTKLYY